MVKKSFIKNLLSAKWLLSDSFMKKYKWLLLFIVGFLVMVYQQYRVEVIYVENVKLKQKLKVVRTKFIYSSVDLMNITLETAVEKNVNNRLPGLKIPKKKPVLIKIPAKNERNAE